MSRQKAEFPPITASRRRSGPGEPIELSDAQLEEVAGGSAELLSNQAREPGGGTLTGAAPMSPDPPTAD
jgi:hypothetical protein